MLEASGMVPNHNHGGREQAGAEAHLLAALEYYANQESFRLIATKFGLTESTIFQAVRLVTNWLISLRSTFIRWPTPLRQNEIAAEFAKKGGIDGIIGAIDGTHIHIKAPAKHGDDYINRKSIHSINLQGLLKIELNKLNKYMYEGRTISFDHSLSSVAFFSRSVTGLSYCLTESCWWKVYPGTPAFARPCTCMSEVSCRTNIYVSVSKLKQHLCGQTFD